MFSIMTIIKLQNGAFVGSSIIEINAFPKADETKSINDPYVFNNRSFLSILEEIFRLSESNTMSLELLWVAQSVSNQTFSSKLRAFWVIRKISVSFDIIEKEIKEIENIILSILKRQNYDCAKVDTADSNFVSLIKDIDCSSHFSVVKSEKIVHNVISENSYYSWDIIPSDSEDTLSSFLSEISHYTNCAVSFSVIPTKLTDSECSVLSQLISSANSNDYSDLNGKKVLNTIKYCLDKATASNFYYSLSVFGNSDSCRGITNKLVSLLQSGKNKLGVSAPIALDLSREKISVFNRFYVYPWEINKLLLNKYRNPNVLAFPIVKILGRMPYLMSSEEVNVFFRLPLYDSTMPQIKEKRAIGDAELFSDKITGSDTIQLGDLISNGSENVHIGCPLKAWTQHALIVGMPGTGKTTFAVNILTQFAKRNIPFLAIEPTKTEYRAMIDTIEELQIFTPGNNNVSPFIINPFIPPAGITVEQYTPSLLSAFKAAFSMDGPLEMIFLKAINACYIEYGWRLNSKKGDPETTVFGMFEYILCFKRIMKSMHYNKDVQNNLETAGLLRLMNLIEQNANIFDTVNTVPIEDLLSKPTVIELNAIENEEQKALIMALLLSNINVYTKTNQKGDGMLKNVILIDEAHVLLDAGNDSENGAGAKSTTVKTVQRMIREIRSYGTSIIIADQTPTAVTEPVVANTNVKIIFRLSAPKDRALIAESTGMKESLAEYIPKLTVGQAFVYFEDLNSAQLVKTEDTRERDGIRLSVDNSEISERMVYWKDKPQNLIPFRECEYCKICGRCSFKVRNDAEFYSSKLLNDSLGKIENENILLYYAQKIPKVLQKKKDKYGENEFLQVCACTMIKYVRKAELVLPITVNMQNIKKCIDITIKGAK